MSIMILCEQDLVYIYNFYGGATQYNYVSYAIECSYAFWLSKRYITLSGKLTRLGVLCGGGDMLMWQVTFQVYYNDDGFPKLD